MAPRRTARGCARSTTVLLSLLVAITSGAKAGAEAPLLPLDRFLTKPRVVQVALSPDGQQLAYLLREDRGVSVWTMDSATGVRVQHAHSNLVRRLSWSTGSRGLFLETSRQVAFLSLPEGRASLIFRLEADREQRMVDVDPVLANRVLITEKVADDAYRLLRVDTTGQSEVLMESARPILGFWLGDDGQVLYRQEVDDTNVVIERVDGERRKEVARCDFVTACGLVAGDPLDPARVVLRQRLASGLWGLVTLDTRTGRREPLHEDPIGLADLAGVVLDPLTRAPALVVHHTEQRRHYPLAPWLAPHLARIEAALPGRDLWIEPRSGGQYWLVSSGGARQQFKRHHLYDRERGTLTAVLDRDRQAADPLPEAFLGMQRHFAYRASDGMQIYGFVTVPPDIDPSGAPLVALIHGGPWNHVQSGFDGLTQLLVNRGYVVFEPNFRASTGYGLRHMVAARGDFGDGSVHQDILDGIDHLTRSGVGDPTRVGIAGHSFGGFAALGAVAYSPERFRAGIASAPAIDLMRALQDFDHQTMLINGLPLVEVFRHLLVDQEDEAAVRELRRRSPEARVAETARPLLMLAGGKDEKIDVVDVKHHAARLAGLGKDVSLFVDDDSGHSFRGFMIRRATGYLWERFLAEHLGGRVLPRTDPALDAYIAANLRLTGESLERALRLPADG